MKNLKYILAIILILCLTKYKKCFTQNYADKDYYLVDSLNLESLSNSDSLLIENSLKEFHKAINDTSKINALNSICKNMMHNDWSKYQFFQYKLIEASLEKKTTEIIKKKLLISKSKALRSIGFIYSNNGDNKKALNYYSKSLKISEEIGFKEGIAQTTNNIGIVYQNKGNIPKALESYHKALKIQEEIKDNYGIATGLNNIGLIYQGQGDNKKALEYFLKSLNILEKVENKTGIASCLNSIAVAYYNLDNNSKALEYFHKCYDIYNELENNQGIAYCLNNLGTLYNDEGNTIKALEYYNKSIIIQKKNNDKKGIIGGLHNIGLIYKDLNNNYKAAEYGKKSLKLAKEIGYPEYINSAANLLSDVFQKQGKYSEALKMYKLSILMRDSIYNEATQKATAQQEAKYKYEKQKLIDDAKHDKQLAIEQEEKAKQKIITYATAGGLGLVAIFLVFVFNRLQVTKKQKLVIEEQRDVVEEAHKEIRDSINYAERIQRSFLATDELLDNNLKDYFVFFQPKDVVSGDFYWAGKLSNNNFALVNADSTGHGVPGAIMSILNISSLEKAVEKGILKPSEIFNHTRNTIIERLSKDGSDEGGKDGMDASIISFDFDNNKFSYTAAQNPIWIIRDGEIIEIKPEKMPLGKHDNDIKPFLGGEFETQKGDVVYTLTDGFQDQFGGEKGKKYKVRPFKKLLLSIAHLPMQEQKEMLNEKFITWKGEEEQVDDVCVIGVRI